MQEQTLDEAPVWDDVTTFDGKPWRGVVDCITGGYPCQPFSTVGKRRGEADERHLFPHIARIIGECRPRWCFFENVMGHLSLGFEAAADTIQKLGYRVAAGVFSASEVGASHQRNRLFILANSASVVCRDIHKGEPVLLTANTSGTMGLEVFPPCPDDIDEWCEQTVLPSRLSRMDDGVADRVDRTQLCGNGVVPLVAAYAWRILRASFEVTKC